MPDVGISPDIRPSEPQVSSREAIKTIAAQTELTAPLPPMTVRMGSSSSRLATDIPTHATAPSEQGLRGEIQGKPLSPRQQEILELASQGLTNAQIAERMNVGVQQVKNYTSVILQKMGVATTIDAIDKGIEDGILDSKDIERDYDPSRLAALLGAERRSYLLLVNAGEDEGFKELAHKAGISYQQLKNEASQIWKKLGISYRQIRTFHRFAAKSKLAASGKEGVSLKGVDVFEGVPLPNQEVAKTSDLTIDELQILTLSAYGLNREEVAEILNIPLTTTKKIISQSIRSKLGAESLADAAVKAMLRGDIVAEEIIPEGIQLKVDGLSPINKKVIDAIVSNPQARYEDLAPQFGVVEKSLRFRTQQIMHDLGFESKEHMIIVLRSLEIAKQKTSEGSNPAEKVA